MRDREIDDLLKRAAEARQEVDPALVDRISGSMGAHMEPVRPLPASWILAAGVSVAGALVALAGGMSFGLAGIHKMSAAEIGVIFPILAGLIVLAAALCVAEAIPGSRRPVAPWLLELLVCAGLAAAFGGLFHDYGMTRFVAQGVKCLAAGLFLAAPAAAATWLVLRRGFAVNTAVSGFARGTLAGLVGVTMLELHCPNFEAPHVLVWHIAVLPISGAVGMWLARRGLGR